MTSEDPGGPVRGDDGVLRCPWGEAAPDYRTYHDTEWGRPVRGDGPIFERITLESFQSGLSWLTILRKREGFRAAFAGFDIEAVAAFGPVDRERLLTDAAIVRNAAKIDATLGNATAAARLRQRDGDGALDALVWSFAPPPAPAPRRLAEIPARTAESAALARALRQEGFSFVGPTTMYALMQAIGLVDDHLAGCQVRQHRRLRG